MPLTVLSMEAGLEALNEGRAQDAIAFFEDFCQKAEPGSRDYLQAQMHLVKTHQTLEQTEQAVALCQALTQCQNAQVQIWAVQAMKGLVKEQVQAQVQAIEQATQETPED